GGIEGENKADFRPVAWNRGEWRAASGQKTRCQHCPVLSPGVPGCLSSAFLDISRQVAAPAFQASDTQLKALPTLPVLARGVSGGLNSGRLILHFGGSIGEYHLKLLCDRHLWRDFLRSRHLL